MKKISKIWILGACLALCGVSLTIAGCKRTEGGQTDPTETVFGEWVTTVEATCEGEGVQTRVSLTDSSVIETRTIPAKGHEWGEWAEETAPTCVVDGVKARECSVCNNKDYEPIAAHGHSWGEWETGKEATCLTGGYDVRVCAYDSKHMDIQAVEAIGHDWGEWVVSDAPTCTLAGSEVRTCRNDNAHGQKRVLAALGHDWTDAVVTTDAACEVAGETTKFCRNDSSHTQKEEIPALEHDWSEWVLTKAPTETEEGEESRYCANGCGSPEHRPCPFLGTEGLTYALNGDETGYIVSASFGSAITELYIPAQHDGLPVLEIAAGAFENCTSLTKVVFGEGVSIYKIGNSAFASCTALEYLALPDSLEEIGAQAFAQSGMNNFRIPESVQKVGAGAFDGWTEDQKIFVAGLGSEEDADEVWNATWRSGCEAEITYETNGEDAYSTNLEFIKIGIDGVKVRARNTDIIGIITIPAVYKGLLVKEIDADAFADCASVRSITIPSWITGIGEGAFRGWTADQTIIVKGYASRQAADAVLGSAWREGCNASISYEVENLPEGTTSIAAGQFVGDTSAQIVIPASVQSVGAGAFSGWTENQTIIVKGYGGEGEADAAWGGAEWREGCNAEIIYGG